MTMSDSNHLVVSSHVVDPQNILKDEIEDELIAKAKGFSILVITSHEPSQNSLKHILNDYGYECVVVSTLDEAITCLADEQEREEQSSSSSFDVVVIDFENCSHKGSENSDPVTFVSNLRENEESSSSVKQHRSAILAIVSSSATAVDDGSLINVSVTKPLSAKQFMSTIEQCIDISLNYCASVDMNVALEQCGFDEEFVKELLMELVEAGRSQVKDIKKYIDELDWDKLNLESHSIKGSAAQLACKPFAQAAFVIERAAKLKQKDDLERYYDKLVQRFAELEQFITNI